MGADHISIQIQLGVFGNVVNSPMGSGAQPQLLTILVHFKRNALFGVAWIAFFQRNINPFVHEFFFAILAKIYCPTFGALGTNGLTWWSKYEPKLVATQLDCIDGKIMSNELILEQ